ncbi:hypothetical protein [Neobacillus drentensis]
MNSTYNNISVIYPNEILKGKEIEFVTISPINESVGVSGIPRN